VKQIFVSTRQILSADHTRIVGNDVGVGINRRPVPFFFVFLAVVAVFRRKVVAQLLILLKRVHGEAKSLDGISKGFFSSCLDEYFGKELFTVGSVDLNFYKRIFLLETRDHRVGFFEIHGRIENHLAFLLGAFNPLLLAGGCGKLRGRKSRDEQDPRCEGLQGF